MFPLKLAEGGEVTEPLAGLARIQLGNYDPSSRTRNEVITAKHSPYTITSQGALEVPVPEEDNSIPAEPYDPYAGTGRDYSGMEGLQSSPTKIDLGFDIYQSDIPGAELIGGAILDSEIDARDQAFTALDNVPEDQVAVSDMEGNIFYVPRGSEAHKQLLGEEIATGTVGDILSSDVYDDPNDGYNPDGTRDWLEQHATIQDTMNWLSGETNVGGQPIPEGEQGGLLDNVIPDSPGDLASTLIGSALIPIPIVGGAIGNALLKDPIDNLLGTGDSPEDNTTPTPNPGTTTAVTPPPTLEAETIPSTPTGPTAEELEAQVIAEQQAAAALAEQARRQQAEEEAAQAERERAAEAARQEAARIAAEEAAAEAARQAEIKRQQEAAAAAEAARRAAAAAAAASQSSSSGGDEWNNDAWNTTPAPVDSNPYITSTTPTYVVDAYNSASTSNGSTGGGGGGGGGDSSGGGGYSCYIATAMHKEGYIEESSIRKIMRWCLKRYPSRKFETKLWRNGYMKWGGDIIAPRIKHSKLARWFAMGIHKYIVDKDRDLQAIAGICFLMIPAYAIGTVKWLTGNLVDLRRT